MYIPTYRAYFIFALTLIIIALIGCRNDDKQINRQDELFLVERVIDGDTIVLESGEKVRYIGIDTPELNRSSGVPEYYANEAYEYNKKLVEGKMLKLVYDVQKYDKYGRILAYVYLADGTFVNAELVKQGYAKVYTFPPNVKYESLFLELQIEARNKNRGLWSEDIAQNDSDPIVYITKTGERYHKQECEFIKSGSTPIQKSKAISQGYKPCSKCKP